MFLGMVANVGERLPEDPGKYPSEGDHFEKEHDAVSAFKYLKISSATLTTALS